MSLLAPARDRFFRKTALNGLPPWSGARVAESGSLLRSYTPKGYRGFESPLLRIGLFKPKNSLQ